MKSHWPFASILAALFMSGCVDRGSDVDVSRQAIVKPLSELPEPNRRATGDLRYGLVRGEDRIAVLWGDFLSDVQMSCRTIGKTEECRLKTAESYSERDLQELENSVNNLYYNFRSFLNQNNIETVIINSQGGSPYVGWSLASAIYDAQVDTIVPETAICMSACLTPLFAGRNHHAYGMVGVHKISYNLEGEITDQVEKDLKQLEDDQKSIRKKIGIPEEIAALANNTPADKMAILTTDLKMRFDLLPESFGWR